MRPKGEPRSGSPSTDSTQSPAQTPRRATICAGWLASSWTRTTMQPVSTPLPRATPSGSNSMPSGPAANDTSCHAPPRPSTPVGPLDPPPPLSSGWSLWCRRLQTWAAAAARASALLKSRSGDAGRRGDVDGGRPARAARVVAARAPFCFGDALLMFFWSLKGVRAFFDALADPRGVLALRIPLAARRARFFGG